MHPSPPHPHHLRHCFHPDPCSVKLKLTEVIHPVVHTLHIFSFKPWSLLVTLLTAPINAFWWPVPIWWWKASLLNLYRFWCWVLLSLSSGVFDDAEFYLAIPLGVLDGAKVYPALGYGGLMGNTAKSWIRWHEGPFKLQIVNSLTVPDVRLCRFVNNVFSL